MMGVKQMRMNLGHAPSVPRNMDIPSNERPNSMFYAVENMRKAKALKAKGLANSAQKPIADPASLIGNDFKE